tara:strand:+ start:32044 stop:32529 length:486 start_codon:yes stop_codon:yes gene_type:complete
LQKRFRSCLASFAFVVLPLASPANAGPSPEEHELIAQIEQLVHLPEGAEPLAYYSRHYARKPDGKVIAVYVPPAPPSQWDDPDYGCEVALPDFAFRPCTEAEIAEQRQMDETFSEQRGSADSIHWHEDYLELPAINDGGCSVVTIIFNEQRQFEEVSCNGQ